MCVCVCEREREREKERVREREKESERESERVWCSCLITKRAANELIFKSIYFQSSRIKPIAK